MFNEYIYETIHVNAHLNEVTVQQKRTAEDRTLIVNARQQGRNRARDVLMLLKKQNKGE